jgi:hypothetical protein
MSQSPSAERRQFEDHRDQVRERLRRPGRPKEVMTVDGKTTQLVGDVERVDREWEDEEARRRREFWIDGRGDRLKDRQAARATMSAAERLDTALQQLSLRLGGMRSRSVEAMRSAGKPDSGAPPAPTDSTRSLDHHLVLIAHHVEAIEREVDVQDGLYQVEGSTEGFYGTHGNSGSLDDFRLRGTAERDRIVFDDFQGVRSEDVAREAPYLGSSARTIERARTQEAERRGLRVRPVDGTVLGPVEEVERVAA